MRRWVLWAGLLLWAAAVLDVLLTGAGGGAGVFRWLEEREQRLLGHSSTVLTVGLCLILALLPILAALLVPPVRRAVRAAVFSPPAARPPAGPLTGGQRATLWAVRASVLAVAAYLALGPALYAGPFRWADLAQQRVFGSSSMALTVLAPLLLLLTVPAAAAAAAGVDGMLFGAPPTPAPTPGEAKRRASRRAALFGAAMLAIGAGAWAATLLSQAAPSTATLDLRTGAVPPPAERVTLTGFRQAALRVTLTSAGRSGVTRTAYTPLTGAPWQPGAVVAYVLAEPHRPASPGAPPGAVSRIEDAVLERGGLPASVRDEYASAGVLLAEPLHVVHERGWGVRDRLVFTVAGGSLALGAGSLLLAWSLRRAAKTPSQPPRRKQA